MKSFLKILITILVILYPVFVYAGLEYLSVEYLGLFIVLLLFLRLFLLRDTLDYKWVAITIVGIVLAVIAMFSSDPITIKLYPVFINLTLFGVFSFSLFKSQSIITKLAIKMSKESLPSYAVAYTWYVTLVWTIFFVINAIISALTVFITDVDIWALYNGFISYVLIGGLMSVELLVRFLVKRHYES